MENSKIISLDASSAMVVLGANVARRGYKVEPLGTSSPVVQVAVRAYKTLPAATVAEVQTLTPSAAPGSGTFKIRTPYGDTSALAYNASDADIQTALRLIPGMGSVTVSGTMATAVAITLTGAPVPFGPITVVENTMQTAGAAEVQTLSATRIPDAGSFSLAFSPTGLQSQEVILGPFAPDASAADLQTALRNATGDMSISVSGVSLVAGLAVTFGARGPKYLIRVSANTLSASQVQTITPDGTPTAGTVILVYKGKKTEALGYDATDEEIETALRALPGLESVEVSGGFETEVEVTMVGVKDSTLIEVDGDSDIDAELTVAEDAAKVGRGDLAITVARTTPGVATAAVEVPKAAITTPGDHASNYLSVSQGEVLDQSDSGDKTPIYAWSDTAVSVKVTEVL